MRFACAAPIWLQTVNGKDQAAWLLRILCGKEKTFPMHLGKLSK